MLSFLHGQRRSVRGLLVIAVILGSSLAPSVSFAFWSALENNQSHFGRMKAPLKAMPRHFRFVNWNVQKAEDLNMPLDYEKLAKGSHLVFFQEAVDREDWTVLIGRAQGNLRWLLARSFFSNGSGGYTGVATGSAVRSYRDEVYLSPVREPIANTPKTSLLSEYPIEGSSARLLVINLHAINFVFDEDYKQHIQQIVSVAEKHQGPLMIAGDFNTWSEGRFAMLTKKMRRLGLQRLEIDNPYWAPFTGPYDHVFVRGIVSRQIQVVNAVNSSDHKPLIVDFKILEAPKLQLASQVIREEGK